MLAVDEEAMLVALRNLVENAAIYGPEGQRVTASFALTGGEARVMIDAQGSGLSDAAAATLRKRFVRGKREPATGSGLGLLIAAAALHPISARLCLAHSKGDVEGTGLSLRGDIGGHRIIKKKK